MHKVHLIISEIVSFSVFLWQLHSLFIGKLEDITSSSNTLLWSRCSNNWNQTIAITPVIGIVHTEHMMMLFAMWNLMDKNTPPLTSSSGQSVYEGSIQNPSVHSFIVTSLPPLSPTPVGSWFESFTQEDLWYHCRLVLQCHMPTHVGSCCSFSKAIRDHDRLILQLRHHCRLVL
jgi:hypothetical protein